jgi:hypothetical protein
MVKEQENGHGTVCWLRAAAGITVQVPLQIYPGAEMCKNHDKQLTYIDRVIVSASLF